MRAINLKEKVHVVVKTAPQPIDPENIAKRAGIGWGTALKYALELLLDRKIKGMRTSKGWVFWVNDLREVMN